MEDLSKRFSIENEEFYRPRYNAAPSHLLPVIPLERPDQISFYHWGVTPEWSKSKSISKKLYTILANDIPRKPSFKKALIKHRCLIPADGYYSWKKISKKSEIPFRFTLAQQAIFSIPALYEQYTNEQDETVTTFTIIVQRATSTQYSFEDTTPVIFSKNQEDIWLNIESAEVQLMDLLLAPTTELIEHYSVSPEIKDINKDSPTLINLSSPADQFGNYSLFN